MVLHLRCIEMPFIRDSLSALLATTRRGSLVDVESVDACWRHMSCDATVDYVTDVAHCCAREIWHNSSSYFIATCVPDCSSSGQCGNRLTCQQEAGITIGAFQV